MRTLGGRYAPVIALLAAAQLAAVALGRWSSRPIKETAVRIQVPLAMGEWVGEDVGPLDRVTLSMANPTDYVLRTYRNPAGRTVEFVVLLGQSKTFHSPGMCLPAAGWSPLEKRTDKLPTEREVEVGRLLVQDTQGERMLVMFFYAWPRGETTSWIRFQLALLAAKVLRGRQSGALVRASTKLAGREDEADAREDVRRLLGEAYPFVRETLAGGERR